MAAKDDTTLGSSVAGDSTKTPKYVTVEKDAISGSDAKSEAETSSATEANTQPTTPVTEASTPDVSKTPTSFSLLDAENKDEVKSTTADTEQPSTGSTFQTAPVSEPAMDISDNSDNTVTEEAGDKSESTEVNDWLNGDKVDGGEGSGGKGKKIAIFVIVLLVIAGIVAGGFYYYKNNLQKEEQTTEVVISEPTPQVQEETPTETPTPEPVDLSEVSVSVLNGSGIPGEAGVVQALLEDAGFTEIDTGNADSYDFLDTGVSIKKGLSRFVYNSINEALGSDFSVVESDELDEDSTYDVIIIVGSEGPADDKEATTPTVTPKPTATKTPTPTPEE